MIINLLKRVFSSTILLFFLFLILNLDKIYFIILLSVIFLISSFEWIKLTNYISSKVIGIIILFFSILSVYNIRFINEENILFLFVLSVCISTDIGGYLFGKIFKGPKLTKISPSKTYSGSFGGLILSLLTGYILIKSEFINLESYYDFNLSFVVLILFISFISQIGDLIISFYKRKSGTKDTGNLIPGHGGLLDRIDGMIFVFIVINFMDILNILY